MEADHFWFLGRRSHVLELLGKHPVDRNQRLLDLGCGTGYLAWILGNFGYRVIGLDSQPAGLVLARQRDPEGDYLAACAEQLPFREHSFDAVIACDVLEHVDDVQSLAEVYRVLKPGGRLILTVPAHPWLWSRRDELAGHRRRYRSAPFRSLVTGTGFRILRWTPYQCLLFPLVLLSRVFGRRGDRMTELEEMPGPFLNRFLSGISGFEVRVSRLRRMPWGSSFVLLAEKQ